MQLTEHRPYEPKKPSTFIAPEELDDLAGHAHRQTIGWLGISLPLLIWLLAGLRPLVDAPSWERLTSISAYFHTGASPAFVGVLVTLGVYLIAYQGYGNDGQRWDRRAARLAGSAAIMVALFPVLPSSSLSGDCPSPLWMNKLVNGIHLGSAAVLFTTFACIALFLFRKHGGTPSPGKAWRNAVYLACGLLIFACLSFILFLFATDRKDIFWPETIAVWCFGISWLVKGRADYTLRAVARKLGA